MKKKVKKQIRFKSNFLNALASLIILSIIVIGVSSFFVKKELETALSFLVLGVVNIVIIKYFKIDLDSVYPDMVFGFIDNGVLVFAAIIGGYFAGVVGAIIGGAAGNIITDGIGGLFEGYMEEKMRKHKKVVVSLRTSLSSSLGKMAGCLFGAGIGLLIVFFAGL